MSKNSSREEDWWGAGLLGGPDRTTWAQAQHTVTYRMLRRHVAAQRQLFDAHGIRPGDTVALQGAGSFSQLWSLFALWSRGVQVMLLGPHLRGAELGRLLDHCRPRFYVSFDAPGHGRETFHDECEIFVRRLVGGRRASTPHCLVQFTSASTGHAKGVGRTAGSILAELDRFRAVDSMPEAGARVLVLGPLAHSFCLFGGVLHAMNVRAVTVFAHDATHRAMLGSALRSGADTIVGSPRHFATLMRTDRPLPMSRLRLAISGGESMDPRLHARFAERHGVRIGQAYGTTETGIIAMDPTGWYGPDTVGMPVPGMRVRLVDGELHVRLRDSPYVLQEAPRRYLDDGMRYRGGWLHTRDLAERDDTSGALRVLGRIDPVADRIAAAHGPEHLQLAGRTRVRLLERGGQPVGSRT